MDRTPAPASRPGFGGCRSGKPAEPLGPAEFASVMAPVLADSTTGVVIAVSGGPDSICLMHLLAERRGRGDQPPLTVATVDHGLRAESAAESNWVVAQAEALGFPARVLRWEGPKPVRAIQEAARQARYALLTELCAQVAASHLLTAHTLDDQAETILFRIARGSGIRGLAGMSASVARSSVVHARPLLDIAKARLIATCATRSWPFLTDPSNRDPRFARARLRTILPSLADEGLDAPRFGRLAHRAARAEAALNQIAETVRRAATRAAAHGGEGLDGTILAQQPAEIMIRVLGAAVEQIGGHPARLSRLESLAADLADSLASRATLRRTLNGATVVATPDGSVTVRREGPRRRGLRRDPGTIHFISKEPPGLADPPRGSLGNGRMDAYIEPRRNAASAALSFRTE